MKLALVLLAACGGNGKTLDGAPLFDGAPDAAPIAITPNAWTFVPVPGTTCGAGGVKLADWIAQWATGDAAWTTVKP